LTIPAQLNHYRILEPLGKGGMGEVFVGEDTRLHRRVAIKVLSGLVATDAERRQRFEREAQAIAALNHPNIVTIHSVEESGGVPFIVMELVEGRPLSEVIKAGGLPLDQLLRIGVNISDAVGTAHQRGITHRDLKPANVMVASDGRVKVLDFGLAKLRETEAEYDGETRLPTGDLTGEGRIIGTVAYMSPEQAEGKPVDSRSDIFSLGVLLHEMAVGERPFQGDTNVSVISSILKDTPSSITDINPNLPAGLAKVVRRSLSKDPSRRYQSAIDLRNELEELKQESDSGITTRTSINVPPPGPARSFVTPKIAAVAGVVVLIGAVAVAAYFLRGRGSPAAIDFVPDRLTRITTSGIAQLAAISGDGRYLVHIKSERLQPSLWIRQTATTSDVQIVPPAPVRYDGLTFAPDGNYVYYVTYELTGGVGSLYRVPVLGGTPQRIVEDIDSPVTFSPDRQQFAFIRGFPKDGRNYVMVANADGTGVRQLGTADGQKQVMLSGPVWSPDGKVIIAPARSLEGGPHSLFLEFEAGTGQSKPVGGRWANVSDSAWMPDGRSFLAVAADFAATRTQLWQVSYPSGERRRVTMDLNNYSGVTISNDGTAIASVQNEIESTLWNAPASDFAKATRVSGGRDSSDGANGIAWAGDGRIVFGSRASGSPQLLIADADGRNATQLTTVQGGASSPSTPASGNFVVFQQFGEKGIHVSRIGLDGSDPKQLTNGLGEFNAVVSPDGKWVYYNAFTETRLKIERVSSDGGEPTTVDGSGFTIYSISPDGKTLLGNAWDAAARRSSLAQLPVEGGTPQLLNLPVAGTPSWGPGGKVISYVDFVDGQAVLAARDLERGVSRPLHSFGGDRLFGFAWSHDGQRIALGQGTVSSDVVMITRK
jgi:serine/threonine protein kinase/Tol biopolymer transport system component